MRTIRKTRPGESHIHNHGTVAGGETIAVDGDTAAYLVDSGGYEYADETDATTDAEAEQGGYLRDAPAEVQIDEGVCPWCDPDERYEGDAVGQHASSAHPDKWDAYKEGGD